MTPGLSPGLLPRFTNGPSGPLFCLDVAPDRSPIRGRVLLLAPFAEEMNRARRMMITLARRLAGEGLATTIADLHGTGDSGGDFAGASWEGWLEDVAFLRRELADMAPLWLAGIRTGALLAAQSLADDPDGIAGTVLIAPVTSGARFLTQLLRIRVAAAMARGGKETTGALKERLRAGETLPVGGYPLTPAMARALEGASLAAASPPDVPVHWFELAGSPDALPSPPQTLLPEAWRRPNVRAHPVVDASFWALQEPTVPETLIDEITATMREAIS